VINLIAERQEEEVDGELLADVQNATLRAISHPVSRVTLALRMTTGTLRTPPPLAHCLQGRKAGGTKTIRAPVYLGLWPPKILHHSSRIEDKGSAFFFFSFPHLTLIH
jgi:hypothetical protein